MRSGAVKMNLQMRSFLRGLIPAAVMLALIPAASVWGQTGQEAISASAPSKVAGGMEAPSGATAAQPAVEGVESTESGSGFSFLKVVGGLGLVLSLIVFGTLAVRRFAPQYLTKRSSERTIKLIESLSMGERRSIAVIEIEDRRLLIGNTPNQITLLASLGDGTSFLSDHEAASVPVSSRAAATPFRNLYETEKSGQSRSRMKVIPPDIRAKMRQLRESMEK
jgi:flagellar protein FliO/FliZ